MSKIANETTQRTKTPLCLLSGPPIRPPSGSGLGVSEARRFAFVLYSYPRIPISEQLTPTNPAPAPTNPH